MTRIEQKRRVKGGKVGRVLQHGFPTVRRDDAERHVAGIGDTVCVCFTHGPGMKCRDLVVVEIRGNRALRTVDPRNFTDECIGNSAFF